MIRDRILVLLVIGCAWSVSGCAARRDSPPRVPDGAPSRDATAQSLDDDDLDASTGDAVPSGPGVAVKQAHVMIPQARGSYNEGVSEGMAGNLDLAEKAFRRTLEIDPAAYEAEYNLGVLLERRGEDAKAQQKYQRALTLQPDYIPAVDAVCRLHIRRGNPAAAVEFMARKAADFPRNILVLTRYADALSASRRYADAIDVAKQALRLDERNAQAMVQIGKANMHLGRTELAQSIFSQVIQIDADIAEVYFLLALIAQRDNNRPETLAQLEAAIFRNPAYVEAINNLAVQFVLSGNYERAIQHLAAAIALSPSWAVLHSNYGNALRGAGRWEDARISLEKSRALDGRLKEALFNLGVLYFSADRLGDLSRMARLKEAQSYFVRYRNEMGSTLTETDPVHRYVKETAVLIEREEQRLAQERRQAEMDDRRSADKDAAASAGSTGAEPQGGIAPSGATKESDDDGWE